MLETIILILGTLFATLIAALFGYFGGVHIERIRTKDKYREKLYDYMIEGIKETYVTLNDLINSYLSAEHGLDKNVPKLLEELERASRQLSKHLPFFPTSIFEKIGVLLDYIHENIKVSPDLDNLEKDRSKMEEAINESMDEIRRAIGTTMFLNDFPDNLHLKKPLKIVLFNKFTIFEVKSS